MKAFWSVLSRGSLARDYAVAGLVFCVLAVFGVQVIVHLIDSMRQNVRVQQATLQPQREEVRNYQISRSVLDDTVVTGSIGKGGQGRPVILDPCTGTVKKN